MRESLTSDAIQRKSWDHDARSSTVLIMLSHLADEERQRAFNDRLTSRSPKSALPPDEPRHRCLKHRQTYFADNTNSVTLDHHALLGFKIGFDKWIGWSETPRCA